MQTIINYIEQLKYKEKILALGNGKGLNTPVLEVERKEAYRFIFATEPHKNHLPPYQLRPKRALMGNRSIGGYGLSCLETQESAENFYNELVESFDKVTQNIGDSLAKGELAGKDGVISEADSKKHFNLFEFRNCDLGCKFLYIKHLA